MDVAIDRMILDSRVGRSGDGFVAVRAERDGHDFVTAARGAGAAVVIVDHLVDDGPCIVVDDTVAALARGGRVARGELAGDVIGMTGSVGKTTTKDLAAAILGRSRRVTASERSLNNELGVPLTLLNAVEGTEVSVIELGARGIGHVAELCEIASPTIGVVTVVAPAHLELFGSLEAIVEAKGELIEALSPSGTAVLNADSAEVMSMAGRTSARVLTFGEAGEVRLTDVELDRRLVVSAVVHSPWGSAPVRLGVSGRHQIVNAAAAAAAALVAGASLEDVVSGLALPVESPWRMEVLRSRSGATVINDSYNANPESMAAALRALADLDAERRVAVLGEMAELGVSSDVEHVAISDLARSLGIELIAIGTSRYEVEPTVAEDLAELLSPMDERIAVLVKGSRVGRLELLAAALLEE